MARKKQSRSVQLIKKLYAQEKKLEKLKESQTILNSEIAKTKTELYSEMENDDLENVTYKKYKYSKSDDIQFSLNNGVKRWDDCVEFFDFLKNTGNEASITTRIGVHPQRRQAILKELYENGIKFPKFIKVSFFNTIKRRAI